MRVKTRLLLEYLAVAGLMIGLTFTPLRLLSILLPIAYLITDRIVRKRTRQEIGFRFGAIPADLKTNWPLLLVVGLALPLLFTLVGKLFVPEYFTHLSARVAPYLALDLRTADKLVFELLALAFGEEIAFRAFLQGRLSLFVKPAWAIFAASVVFAGLHVSSGAPPAVGLDLASVFADSLVYGILYKRTGNVFVTTLAHFLGNAVGIVLLLTVP